MRWAAGRLGRRARRHGPRQQDRSGYALAGAADVMMIVVEPLRRCQSRQGVEDGLCALTPVAVASARGQGSGSRGDADTRPWPSGAPDVPPLSVFEHPWGLIGARALGCGRWGSPQGQGVAEERTSGCGCRLDKPTSRGDACGALVRLRPSPPPFFGLKHKGHDAPRPLRA